MVCMSLFPAFFSGLKFEVRLVILWIRSVTRFFQIDLRFLVELWDVEVTQDQGFTEEIFTELAVYRPSRYKLAFILIVSPLVSYAMRHCYAIRRFLSLFCVNSSPIQHTYGMILEVEPHNLRLEEDQEQFLLDFTHIKDREQIEHQHFDFDCSFIFKTNCTWNEI